jgi:hypothetical protein
MPSQQKMNQEICPDKNSSERSPEYKKIWRNPVKHKSKDGPIEESRKLFLCKPVL